LVDAQELGIYFLPSQFNSKTRSILRRFDKMDLAQCPLSQCGKTTLFTEILKPVSLNREFIRVVVSDAKGMKKPLTLTEKQTVDELLKLGSQKLKLKTKATKAQTLQGENVDDLFLKNVELDTVIRIM